MRVGAAWLLGVLAAAATAEASTLGVAPIRAELSSKVGTAVITVRNQEDKPVVVQARPASWSQQGGEDQLGETRDLLVTPPLFTLPPKGRQLLRVALLRQVDPTRELAYRLVISEVPPAATPEVTGLRVALQITLPVFVAPEQGHALPDLSWQHSWLPNGKLAIEAQNHGNAHLQILDFDVQGDNHPEPRLHADNSHYLLPGSVMRWELAAPADMPRADRLLIHGHSDAGDFSVTSDRGAK